MSIQAINYVLNTRVGKASDKLVLLCLANYADENGYCYPSQAALVENSDLDRKTVISSLNSLLEAGHIIDTGRRSGATHQVVVYQLVGIPEFSTVHYTYRVTCTATGEYYLGKRSYISSPESDVYRGSCKWVEEKQKAKAVIVREVLGTYPTAREALLAESELFKRHDGDPLCINLGLPSKHRERAIANSPKNGTVPKTEQSRNSRETVPFFPSNSPENGTRNHQGTIKEPSPTACDGEDGFNLPPEIPKDLWQRFESHRKRIKEPLSNRARNIAATKLLRLSKEGHGMCDLMDEAEVNNWKTFYPPREVFKGAKQKPKQTGAIYV